MKAASGLVLAATLLVLAAAPRPSSAQNAAAPRFDAWRIIGPGGGGAMFFPTVSPHDPKDVVIRCDMTGGYVSHDGGESWRNYNVRAPANFFVWDPVKPGIVYAGTGPLWRSRDSARTWELVFPLPSSVLRIDRIGDHAGDRFITKDGRDRRIVALAVDPGNSDVLYAGISESGVTALHVSVDWGRSWSKIADLPLGARQIWVDPNSPAADRILYVASGNTILVRRGGAWTSGSAPRAGAQVLDVGAGFSPETGELVVYAVTDAEIHISRDGGRNWRSTEMPGPARYKAVATALNRPDTAYVSYTNLLDSQAGGTTRFFGVAKTENIGETWTAVWKEASAAGSNIYDSWLTERFGPGWGGSPINLGVAPNNPEICYGTDYGRTMRSTDGGRTWYGIYSKRFPNGYVSTGLDVTTNYGVHWDPFDRKRVFISYTDIGLFRSEDGGATWLASSQGVPRSWVNTTYWMEFDPEVKGRVWAVMSGTHDLPRPKMWRTTPVSKYVGGVTVSDDGGRTWRAASATLPETAATHIVLDPASPASARTLYFTGFGRGVFKSTDGGRSWSLKNRGIAGAEPYAWRLTRDPRGTLYLIVARGSENGSIGNDQDGALYRSEDAAENWTKVALPAGANGPNGLAVDPADPNRLYLAAWGRAVKPADVDGGIYLSTDRGASWNRVLDRDQHIYDVTIDPRDPNVLYASGFSSSAWRSADRGLTWQRIRGYNFKWGHRVVPDPDDPEKIFVTTFGGSVWHGPARGDPNAVEDIITPQAAYSPAERRRAR